MSSPFGTSNQGGYQGPPTSTQAAPQQGFGGGAGYGGYGGFGGFQSQPSYGGFGGGFGGFNPMFGGLGGLGFNPMMGMGFMQPMPFFGGFGGGFSPYQQPQFNPMFGGLGGLGFNPMMGGQFMQPMQRFDPYQQQMFQPRGLNFDDSPMGVRPDFTLPAGFVEEAAQQNFPSMDMRYRGGPQMSPEMRQRREQDMRNMERMAQQPEQTFSTLGGIGGLGFNPMMGSQFGMPIQGMGGYGGFNPYQPPQQREQLLQDQRRFGNEQSSVQSPLNQEQLTSLRDSLSKAGVLDTSKEAFFNSNMYKDAREKIDQEAKMSGFGMVDHALRPSSKYGLGSSQTYDKLYESWLNEQTTQAQKAYLPIMLQNQALDLAGKNT